MKTRIKKFRFKLLIFFVLMSASLSLTACTSTTQESSPDNIEDQQTEITIPIVESDVVERGETEAEKEAYPDTEQETQNQDINGVKQDKAYPEPEVDIASQMDSEDTQKEAYPDPQEEPIQEIQPTPRGNELVASNPSTVNLASGQLQLVELFAFW